LKLTDETLKVIRLNPQMLKDMKALQGLLQENGDNFHIVRIQKNEGIIKVSTAIRKGFKEFVFKYKPKSISWFNQDMSRFIYWRP